MKLSVIIPVYNERETLPHVLQKVITVMPEISKEIVVVDDCSRDGTTEWLKENLDKAGEVYQGIDLAEDGAFALIPNSSQTKAGFEFKTVFHEQNKGKGGAVITGLAECTGDVMVIQDADLEYDPRDWSQMWELIADLKVADVVYGSRFYGRPHRSLNFHHFLANRLISFIFNILFNQTLSDIEVCYKMFTRQVLETLRLTARDFGIEVQFSAQVAKKKTWRIYEVGIRYYGRTYDEGKKINWKDGLKALWYLVKFRLKD